jgi:hypothetical protein
MMAMWRLAVPMLVCVAARAQDVGLEPDALQLAKIKLHMMDTLRRQPNYTCLETVERSHRDASTRKYRLEDTLRLEVALVDGKEMFAWPGSKQFEDKDIRTLVPTGTFGTGDFALHARALFGGNSAIFQARGQQDLEGRAALRFDFRVPRPVSGYQIRIPEFQTIVGYHGSFYVDPSSLDLRQLEIAGDDLPPELKLKSLSDRMDYARARIGDADFLLPESSEVVLVDLNGQENRNRLKFTSCHQFTGQSVLSFEDLDPSAASAPVQKIELELPPDLELTLSLLDSINAQTAAIGDPVRAQLRNDLKVKGRVLLGKGAEASGRVSRLERHENFTIMGLIFTDLESPSTHVKLDLQFDRFVGFDTLPPNRRLALAAPPMPHEALVPLRSGGVRVMRGSLIFWRTTSADSSGAR